MSDNSETWITDRIEIRDRLAQVFDWVYVMAIETAVKYEDIESCIREAFDRASEEARRVATAKSLGRESTFRQAAESRKRGVLVRSSCTAPFEED